MFCLLNRICPELSTVYETTKDFHEFNLGEVLLFCFSLSISSIIVKVFTLVCILRASGAMVIFLGSIRLMILVTGGATSAL